VYGERKLKVKLAEVGKNNRLVVATKAADIFNQLLSNFYATEAPTVGTPKELAQRLVGVTNFVRDQIIAALESGDLVVWLPYFPRQSETLLATDFKMFASGKGFNQAVSARRCEAQVGMVGKVGADQFGGDFVHLMDQEGIDHAFVV